MKNKTNKLRQLEKNRYSVFFDDLSMCCQCGCTYEMTKHEIFEGRNRQNSMKYGFVLPLCLECHRQLQHQKSFSDKWKRKAQTYYEENIGTREDFIKIFRRSYL